MDLFEAWKQLDKLEEDINSTEVATWVALPEYLKDILATNTLLTSDNSNRPKTSGLYDVKGNHICFSTDHLNPANVLQKFNFGLLFDRSGLEDYCSENKDLLKIRKTATSETESNWLTRHTDFTKNLAISETELIKSFQGGIYVLGLAETVSNKKIIKLLNWERPIQIHDDNPLELEFWNALVDAFKTYGPDHGFWLVDDTSDEEERTQLGTAYSKLYCIKPVRIFKGIKQLPYKYKYSTTVFPQECIRLYSEHSSSDIQILAPKGSSVLATISNPEVKNHIVDDMTQEEEFRLYFEPGVQEFKFDPKLLKTIYLPSAYFIADKELHNIANNFLDLELLYAMFIKDNKLTANANNPDTLFTYIYHNLEKFNPQAIENKTALKTAKANFDYNYSFLKSYTNVSVQDLYWALRLAAFTFPVNYKLKDTTVRGVVNAVEAITKQRNMLLEIFKIIRDKYPQANIQFYKRVITKGDVSPHVELDQAANTRFTDAAASGKDPSRVLANIKNRAIHQDRIKNRHMDLT